MRWTAAAAVLALLVPSVSARSADDITLASVAALQRWDEAVRQHSPGQADDPVKSVLALTFDQRKELNTGMGFFLGFLQGKPLRIKTEAEARLAKIAAASRIEPGPDAFLKRAAVLHADAAFARALEGGPATELVTPDSGGRGLPPLLSQGRLYVDRDGEILGQTPTDWNWPFARSLVDLLLRSPAEAPFAGAWYHATTAFMFRHLLYGEAMAHLQRAGEVLPEDANILFDRACYSEYLGLPRSQVLLSDQDLETLRAQRAGRSSLIRMPASSSMALGIPIAEVANDEAERLFRRAMGADPGLVEARVRLGRLLEVRKRYDEAASELSTALAAHPTGAVSFYAHLFAGRADQGLGKTAGAAGHYRAAEALFPGAQSAALALSQALVLQSDVPAALDAIRRVDKSSTARDPWWWYHFGAGRDSDALLAAMWGRFPKS